MPKPSLGGSPCQLWGPRLLFPWDLCLPVSSNQRPPPLLGDQVPCPQPPTPGLCRHTPVLPKRDEASQGRQMETNASWVVGEGHGGSCLVRQT